MRAPNNCEDHLNFDWEDTPTWMFWKPTKRRLLSLGTCRCHASGLYEYQHPAFVAREIMEKTFGPTKAD